MSRILLGVTGSVAAVRTPALYRSLIDAGHAVRVVATEPSLVFFDPRELGDPIVGDGAASIPAGPVVRDADEWPAGRLYRRGEPVLHIELRRWADVLVIAPLDANTLAKIALGFSDNCLTCVFRAWDFRRPVILAPAMNTLMWESPVTRRHLAQLLADRAASPPPDQWSLEAADEIFASHAPNLVLVPPRARRLACGDIGVGAMADVTSIAETVMRELARSTEAAE
jgi:phosphopantothenoylcysteine decarboxylase